MKGTSVNGMALTAAQRVVLKRFAAEAEVALDEMDPRTARGLEGKGLATIEAMELKASPAGKALGKQLAAGTDEAPPAAEKPARKKSGKRPRVAAGSEKGNGAGGLTRKTVAELRASLDARYRAAIAALEQLAVFLD